MEQRCVQLFGSEWEKNTTVSLYIVSGVSLPCGAFVFEGVFFFFFFFWHDSKSKMAGELSLGSSVRVLKLDGCSRRVCSCILLVFIDSVPAYGKMCCSSSLKTLIHSRWHRRHKIQGRLLLMVRLTAWSHGRYRTPPLVPGSDLWTNTLQFWDLSPWKHMLKRGIRLFRKRAFSSSFTLILEEKQDVFGR